MSAVKSFLSPAQSILVFLNNKIYFGAQGIDFHYSDQRDYEQTTQRLNPEAENMSLFKVNRFLFGASCAANMSGDEKIYTTACEKFQIYAKAASHATGHEFALDSEGHQIVNSANQVARFI